MVTIYVQVDLKHVEHFIGVIGAFEDQIFQKRARLLDRQKQRRERDKAHQGQGRGQGAGQAATKWKSQQPSAAFNAALQPVAPQQPGAPQVKVCYSLHSGAPQGSAIPHMRFSNCSTFVF